jgi:hypothetical protein
VIDPDHPLRGNYERAWRGYLYLRSLDARRCGLTGTILKSRMPKYFPREDG